LHQSGYEVVFADVNGSLIDQLNAQPSYKVIEVGNEGTTESVITNYRALNSKTQEPQLVQEIATADVVTCSVGPNILKFIAPVIAKGIDQRPTDLPPMAVIACENAIGATDTLAEHIKEPQNTPADRIESMSDRARFANSAIDRIVPAQDPDAGLDVKLEKFYEWVVESTPFKGYSPPSIEGIHWVEDLKPYIERKLYTVNTGHATAAYHGYNRRKSTVYDALQDREIRDEVSKALSNTSPRSMASTRKCRTSTSTTLCGASVTPTWRMRSSALVVRHSGSSAARSVSSARPPSLLSMERTAPHSWTLLRWLSVSKTSRETRSQSSLPRLWRRRSPMRSFRRCAVCSPTRSSIPRSSTL
jgi:hypothetical protein